MGAENTRRRGQNIPNTKTKNIKKMLNNITRNKLLRFKEKQLLHYKNLLQEIKGKLDIAKKYPGSILKDILIYNSNGKHKGTRKKFINPEDTIRINNLELLLKEYTEKILILEKELTNNKKYN